MYIAVTRSGPQPLSTKDELCPEMNQAAQAACKKNLTRSIARQNDPEHQKVPSWTGFNIRTRDQVQVFGDVVGYLPTVNAPATELTTVFEIINQSELIRKELQSETAVVVMDQALYAKATEITWRQTDSPKFFFEWELFYTICNALSIIGKCFREAGLKDICIESGIVASESVNAVLDGKHYNRAIRVHRCICEVLMRLVWKEFMSSI